MERHTRTFSRLRRTNKSCHTFRPQPKKANKLDAIKKALFFAQPIILSARPPSPSLRPHQFSPRQVPRVPSPTPSPHPATRLFFPHGLSNHPFLPCFFVLRSWTKKKKWPAKASAMPYTVPSHAMQHPAPAMSARRGTKQMRTNKGLNAFPPPNSSPPPPPQEHSPA